MATEEGINGQDAPRFGGDSGDGASLGEELRAQSMEALDFPEVRRQVAGRVTFFPARELALGMSPSHSPAEVEELQRETAEAVELLEEVDGVDLHLAVDTSEYVAMAGIGGVLTGTQLLSVADSLEVHSRATGAVGRTRGRLPLLADVVAGIPDLSELRRQIRRKIDARGNVADDATPSLRALRRQVVRAYDRVTETLQRLIRSEAGREALQESLVTTRNERVVVPVKAEMRSRVPGIVHDASNTGATIYVEPFATVDMGNEWRELVLEEERETLRVLRDLSMLVGELAEDIGRGDRLTARLDFILARARYGAANRCVSLPPRVARGNEGPPDTSLRLLEARHPLLGREAVPIDVSLGTDWRVLVITGPNTGGKTVAMKTVGLLALMYQSGLQVPAAEGSSLPVFDGIYADVGDHQSISESVSTFSSHMRNVARIIESAGPGSLVLLDELGASTDPEEGAALGRAVLDHLAGLGVSTIATTHHRQVATHAEASPDMGNASVQLEPDTLEPTYELTMGIPGRSYAMSVAARLGLMEEIMERAKSLLEPQHLRFEDWLRELQADRTRLQTRLREAEETRAEAEGIRRELQSQLDYLADHRDSIMRSTRRETLQRFEDARRKLRRIESALAWTAPAADGSAQRARIDAARLELERASVPEPVPVMRREVERRPIGVGDSVDVGGLNLVGKVLSLPDQGDEAEVSVGRVTLRVDLGRLTRVEDTAPEPENEAPTISYELAPPLGTQELDLRGLRAADALVRLEEFLDGAMRDGLGSVRVIHGRGTGALRHAVREHLARHTLVREFASEPPERGGNGATAVQLA